MQIVMRHKGTMRLLLALLLTLSFCQSVVRTQTTSTMDEIESLTAAEFSKEPLGSLNIAIVSGGQLAWTKSYGYANIEEKTPATADTVYRIGSVTTHVVATRCRRKSASCRSG
jgi:CubicO group peptidase (beta-lactamase class C family)